MFMENHTEQNTRTRVDTKKPSSTKMVIEMKFILSGSGAILFVGRLLVSVQRIFHIHQTVGVESVADKDEPYTISNGKTQIDKLTP